MYVCMYIYIYIYIYTLTGAKASTRLSNDRNVHRVLQCQSGASDPEIGKTEITFECVLHVFVVRCLFTPNISTRRQPGSYGQFS